MRLEDFIKNNYGKFNDDEPAEGHFERFETLLKNRRAPRKIRFKPYYYRIAAILAGLLIASTCYLNYRKNQANGCILSAEVQNARSYYAAQMNERIDKLRETLGDVRPATREKIMKDVEVMKNTSENLPETFCDGSKNKKAIAAIVRHYEAKINAIQSITVFMEESKGQQIGYR